MDLIGKPTIGARWAGWATRRRRWILGGALLVGMAATPISAHLPLHGDLSYLLPPETQSVRDLHSLEARAQVFGTIIVGVDSDQADQRLATASLIADRLRALPASAVISVSADSAARDQFAWAHRQLLIPTDDLQAMADDLRERKARLNPLFVSLDSPGGADTAKTVAPGVADRLHDLKKQFDAVKHGAQSPAPLVSPDGRIQIIIVRTRFAASEVSRNAATVRATAISPAAMLNPLQCQRPARTRSTIAWAAPR